MRGAGGDRRTSDSKEKEKAKTNCFYILEYVSRVYTVLFYDKLS